MTSFPDSEFHHVGVVCVSIAEEEVVWRAFGYVPEGDAFDDPMQGVRARFLVGGGPRIELLEALPGSQTLEAWLKRRVKFYHFGYRVADLDAAVAFHTQAGAVFVRPPEVSPYFGGGRLAFLMLSNAAFVELIEKRKD